jgi:hypothetical protein
MHRNWLTMGPKSAKKFVYEGRVSPGSPRIFDRTGIVEAVKGSSFARLRRDK